MRRFLVLLHRWAGLVLGGFLLIAALTGCLLVVHHELDAALNPGLLSVEEQARPTLGPTAAAQAAERQWPGARADLIYLDRQPGEPLRVRVRPARADQPIAVSEVYLDPWTGQSLGGRDIDAPGLSRAQFMPTVFRLHQQLLIEPPLGKWITGGVALVWLFHSLSGLWLTFPRGSAGFWRRWQPAWQVKRGAGRARLEFDLHRAAGLWLWVVMAMLAFSAVYFNLRQEVFVPVVELFSPVTPVPTAALPKKRARTGPALGYEAALDRARTLLPAEARAMPLRYVQHLPGQAAYRVAYEPADGIGFEQLVIDETSGALLAARGTTRGSAADRLMAWQFPLHSGQAFGWPGRAVIAAAGLAVALLSVTGWSLWWRRHRARQRQPAAQPAFSQPTLR